MQQLTQAQVQQQDSIAQQIRALLQDVSVTFAQLTYTTQVKTAAAHKAVCILKQTNANVQLFSNINSATSVFANAVKKSAGQNPYNDQQNVQQFRAQENYFEHTDCHSIVRHKVAGNLYLYAIFNKNSSSDYTIDGQPATKQDVAQFLTPGERDKLLNSSAVTHNKTHNVEHEVIVRTIALHNIQSITAMKQNVQF
jgi:hypothetical protein